MKKTKLKVTFLGPPSPMQLAFCQPFPILLLLLSPCAFLFSPISLCTFFYGIGCVSISGSFVSKSTPIAITPNWSLLDIGFCFIFEYDVLSKHTKIKRYTESLLRNSRELSSHFFGLNSTKLVDTNIVDTLVIRTRALNHFSGLCECYRPQKRELTLYIPHNAAV